MRICSTICFSQLTPEIKVGNAPWDPGTESFDHQEIYFVDVCSGRAAVKNKENMIRLRRGLISMGLQYGPRLNPVVLSSVDHSPAVS